MVLVWRYYVDVSWSSDSHWRPVLSWLSKTVGPAWAWERLHSLTRIQRHSKAQHAINTIIQQQLFMESAESFLQLEFADWTRSQASLTLNRNIKTWTFSWSNSLVDTSKRRSYHIIPLTAELDFRRKIEPTNNQDDGKKVKIGYHELLDRACHFWNRDKQLLEKGRERSTSAASAAARRQSPKS